MRFWKFLLMVLIYGFLATAIQAQDSFLPELEVITADNLHRIEQIAMFHRGTIEEMAWSPDSTRLATAGSAGGWIYDVNDMQVEPIHFAKTFRLTDVDFHPDGEKVITPGEDAIYEWDVTTGNLIREIAPDEFRPCPMCPANVRTVKYSPDGRYIAAGAFHADMLLLDTITAEVVGVWQQRFIFELFFSPDGQYLAIHGDMRRLTILSIDALLKNEPPEYTTLPDGAPFGIGNLIWTPDSNSLFIAGQRLYKYDIHTGDASLFTESGTGNVTFASNSVITSHYEATDKWWRYVDFLDWQSGERLKRFEVAEWVSDLRVSPDEKYLAVGFISGKFELWNIEEERREIFIENRGGDIREVALVSDRFLLGLESESYDVPKDGGACGDMILHMWDLQSGEKIHSWYGGLGSSAYFKCHTVMETLPDSQYIVFDASDNIVVFNPLNDEYYHLPLPEEYTLVDRNVTFKVSNNGLYLATAAVTNRNYKKLIIWDMSSNLNPHDAPVLIIDYSYHKVIADFIFSSDNENVLIVNTTGELSLWNIETGEQSETIDWDVPRYIYSIKMAIHPDNDHILLNVGELHFFDASDYTVLDVWTDDEYGTGQTVYYTVSGDWFMTRETTSQPFRLWRIEDRTSESRLPVQMTQNHIVFSEDGKFFVTGGTDGAIRIWGVPAE